MRYKCKCGKSHNFEHFLKMKATWGGVISVYQYFCKELNQLMIVVTKTFKSNKTLWSLCPHTAKKKFIRLSSIMNSDEFLSEKIQE